jgi:hypothetical protein
MPPAAAVMLDLVLQFYGYLGVLMKLTGNGWVLTMPTRSRGATQGPEA